MTYLTGKVMTGKLISILEDHDVISGESLMKTHKIRHLPVVNSENELSGILSIRDVVRAKDKTSMVKTIMTTPVRTVKKDANIKTVIALMLKYKISAVLVADNNEVVGIVTTDDLLKLLHEVLEDGDSLESMEISSFFDDDWNSNFAH